MRRYFWILLIALVILFLFARQLAWFWTEWLWFREVDYTQVFWTRLVAKWVIGFSVGVLFALLIYVNLAIAQKLIVWRTMRYYPPGLLGQIAFWLEAGFRWMLAVVALSFGMFAGIAAAKRWEAALLFWYATPLGSSDPIFGKDISFYLFRLPFWRFLYEHGIKALGLALILAVLFYGFYAVADLAMTGRLPQTARSQLRALMSYATPFIRLHLFTLIALLLLMGSVHFYLEMFELLYGKGADEAVWGAGYTDLHVRLPVLLVLMGVFVISAILVVWNIKTRTPAKAGIVLVAVFAATWLIGSFLPNLFQRFVVKPNELMLEKPYLRHNIQMTRLAYGIHDERLSSVSYPFREEVSADALERNKDLLTSIRLWDYRWLKLALFQLQAIHNYYEFFDVDVDRYTVNGLYRQVMLTARELNPELLQAVGGRTWINRYLQYTHGYGAVVVPVNEVGEEGMPILWVRDIPPKSEIKELKLTRPEIYFGELTNDYAVVKTDYPEYDYPKGTKSEEMARTTYEGKGGVPIGSYLGRLAFSLRFNEPNFLLTGAFKPESKILFRRNIHERIRAIAPFLLYDNDPYLVIADGRLFWICDAYTFSGRFPYSEPTFWEQQTPVGRERVSLNYIRNSVKVVIDAYHGTVNYYIADEDDPIVQTYARIFPKLFRPLSEMPKSLQSHLRYPVTYFRIQAERLNLYHITDVGQFYNRLDLWEIARAEDIGGGIQQVEPYYVMMRLPSKDGKFQSHAKFEFILILPFTPAGKRNLIALLAARCDPPHYGQLLILEMPRGKFISGTEQVDARINTDTYISQLRTLWGQQGSKVRWGALLAIPLDGALLYLKPLFLIAEQTELPELKRVIIATQKQVLMEESLQKALERLTDAGRKVPADEKVIPIDVVDKLSELVSLIEESAQKGDWTKFGEGLKNLKELVQQMRQQPINLSH